MFDVEMKSAKFPPQDLNVQLFLRLRREMLETPANYWMGSWLGRKNRMPESMGVLLKLSLSTDTRCQTTCCIAGSAVIEAARQGRVRYEAGFFYLEEGGQTSLASEAAAFLLGITEDDASRLFFHTNWYSFWPEAEDYIHQNRGESGGKLMAMAIEKFLEDKGVDWQAELAKMESEEVALQSPWTMQHKNCKYLGHGLYAGTTNAGNFVIRSSEYNVTTDIVLREPNSTDPAIASLDTIRALHFALGQYLEKEGKQ